jgi:predicted nucleic acid-binding protein
VRLYVDSSVILRVILGEPDPLSAWPRITDPVTSELTRIECLRTLDRARILGRIDEPTLARVRADLLRMIEAFTVVSLDAWITARAADPFPTLVRALDALHLASAMALRGASRTLPFATHDREMAIAAEALGFDVLS